jgi:hypothetical protein
MRRLSLNPDLFLQVIKDVREIAHTYRRSVTSLPELQNRHPPETLFDAERGEQASAGTRQQANQTLDRFAWYSVCAQNNVEFPQLQ